MYDKKIVFVGCDYNSLSNSNANLRVDLDKFLEEFSRNIDCLYLVGDMNIDLLKQDSITEKFNSSTKNILACRNLRMLQNFCSLQKTE